ncbi:MAG: hypothetical protein J6U54_07450 [Clostridiales bacterium]|nr:hypothetical protein [Clostridiales bacterium]
MKKSKIFAAVIALAMICGVATACTSEADESKATEDTTAETTVATTEATTEATTAEVSTSDTEAELGTGDEGFDFATADDFQSESVKALVAGFDENVMVMKAEASDFAVDASIFEEGFMAFDASEGTEATIAIKFVSYEAALEFAKSDIATGDSGIELTENDDNTASLQYRSDYETGTTLTGDIYPDGLLLITEK